MIFVSFVYFFSHWWGFQLGFEIFEIKFKETWNFAEYIEEKSWDNPTKFLTYEVDRSFYEVDRSFYEVDRSFYEVDRSLYEVDF